MTEQPHSSESPGPQEGGAKSGAPPGCPPGTLRFAAHLGLALCALGLIPAPHDASAGLRFRALQASTLNQQAAASWLSYALPCFQVYSRACNEVWGMTG
jgi:hypothetical protein